MDEGTTLAVRGLISSCGILETLNDSLHVDISLAVFCIPEARTYSLSRAIVADDQGKRCEELDGLASSIVERTDSVLQDQ
jgi:hypothetical protein